MLLLLKSTVFEEDKQKIVDLFTQKSKWTNYLSENIKEIQKIIMLNH